MSSTVRCTCPNCRGVYRVPDYALDTEHACPFCKRKVILTACGGRTKLELAGVSGTAKTTLHASKSGSKTAVLVPEAVVPATERKWLWGAIAGSIVLAVCCGGCGIGGLLWWGIRDPKAARQSASGAKHNEIAQQDSPRHLEEKLSGAQPGEVQEVLGKADAEIDCMSIRTDFWTKKRQRLPGVPIPGPDLLWIYHRQEGTDLVICLLPDSGGTPRVRRVFLAAHEGTITDLEEWSKAFQESMKQNTNGLEGLQPRWGP